MNTVIIGLFCFGAVVVVIATMIIIVVARFILRGFRNDD